MEQMNLHHLSLFIMDDVYLIPGEEANATIYKTSAQPLPQENSISREEIEENLKDLDNVKELHYEGNFEKGVLVIIDEVEFKSELKELLFKILGAVNCALKDIALVNASELEGTSIDSIQRINPSKIILFGKVAHDIMHYREDLYKISVEDSIEFLFADQLSAINSNVTMKKSLWNQLQILFGIQK
ncbi:hypothetical protein [Mongoliitalea daihaiensis]|uniref:hypothetical protein n=1 Tax=Mongoliitalea daihaiensis TaxID=2782006 RepID=UPI001F1B20F4|nr:hypothetical protein [Mongoliitalea daihaiensis]UJP64312.1 hypothetical protein IPZ59_16085 [Mongoliitalea daihaiensis]